MKTREAYRKYLADMMTQHLRVWSDAAARADRVLAVETEIAKVSWTRRADRRNEDKIYNPMPASALKTLAPDFTPGMPFSPKAISHWKAAQRQRALCDRGGKNGLRSAGNHL